MVEMPSYCKYIYMQIPSEHEVIAGFGAVVPDGYGICYNSMKSKYFISISSFW